MSSFEKKSRRKPHLEVPKPATESQAVIGWGEQFLARAHELAHEIEEHVRQLLNEPAKTASPSSPTNSNHSPSNSHAGDEPARNEVLVDNRRWDG